MALCLVQHDGYRSTRTCYDLAGKVGRLWVARSCQNVWAQRPMLEETGCQAAYCKHTVQGSPNRLTCTVTIVSAAAHHSYKTQTLHTLRGYAFGRTDLASALTIDCHTGLCFYDRPRWYNTMQYSGTSLL